MVEYKIFVDHQFKEIYNGEFIDCIINNIINPLVKLEYDVTISNNEEETIDILSKTKFDLIICTGYALTTYASAFTHSGLKNKFKFIQIIYDINSEKIIEHVDSINLSKLISQKSKLILLADKIITFSKIVKNEIIDLYKDYDDIFHVSSKISVLGYKYPIFPETNKLKRIVSGKYIVIDTCINGASFLIDNFDWLINNIKEEKPNFKIVLIADKLPKEIYNKLISSKTKEHFILLGDIEKEELANLYKYSIASIFPSTIDINPEKIYLALIQKSIIILNENNKFYDEYFPNCSIFDFKNTNIIKSINTTRKFLNKYKDNIIDEQSEDLDKLKTNTTNGIESIVNKIRTITNNTKKI